MGQAYTSRDVGHTDWTVTMEVDLDHSDAQLGTMLTMGAAITGWFYTDLANTKGWTGAGVITAAPVSVGAQTTTVSITMGGNAALAAIS